ncbi:MAG: hypothetical protein H0U62_14080 [Actinobacteria bacterium]|nr:hypothetical protein [Actinomycetota bacterium]
MRLRVCTTGLAKLLPSRFRQALQALIERKSARRLARLGGSEPEIEEAPRHRCASA